MNPAINTVQATEGFPHRQKKLRYILFTIALIIGLVMYHYIVHFFDPNNDILSQFKRAFVQESYTFFSGSEGGFYIDIGQALQNATQKRSSIVITNRYSLGAEENARSVMITPRSFGLVQEDTVPDGDFVRDHIEYISPLYLERMHILYDYNKYKTFMEKKWPGLKSKYTESVDENTQDVFLLRQTILRLIGIVDDLSDPNDNNSVELPKLSEKVGLNDPHVLAFLEHASMSPGPVGSGSRFFATYLFAMCGIKPKNIHDIKFDEALDRLGEDMDVVFTIAGAPLERVQKKLDSGIHGRFRLMAIDPSLVPSLNNKFNLKLRAASFKDKYRRCDSISTIGTWAFLIASKDVPKSVSLQVLRYLEDSKQEMRSKASLYSSQTFQLDEFDFYAGFAEEHTNYLLDIIRSLMIFTVTVSLHVAIIIVFLSWAYSEYRKIKYYRTLINIYRDYLPTNENLIPDESSAPNTIPKPVIHSDQKLIVKNLVEGMSRLLRLSGKVRGAYDNGEITMKHYDHLVCSIGQLKCIIQRNLAQRFNELMDTSGTLTDLRHYYTAGYLRREDFRDLDEKSSVRRKGVAGTNTSTHKDSEPTLVVSNDIPEKNPIKKKTSGKKTTKNKR